MIESKDIPSFNLIKAYKMQLVLSDMHTLDPAHVNSVPDTPRTVREALLQ